MIIIFDIGGVVVKGRISHLYDLLVRKLNVNEREFFHVKGKHIDDALIGRITTAELMESIALALNLDPDYLKEKWREAFYEAIIVNEDVLDIIRRLKKEHRVVALTNVIEFDTESCSLRGDYACFEKVFTSWELRAAKPGMEIYMMVLNELGADPKECVFIDDAEENLVSAAALGMRAIHFRDAAQLKSDLHSIGAL